MKKNLFKQYFVYFIFVTCLILVFRFGGFIKSWVYEYNHNSKLQNKLVDKYELENKDDNNGNQNSTNNNLLVNQPSSDDDIYWNYVDEEFLNIDFDNLKIENNETVGWIYVNGTSVDYPVVQTNDNKFYLEHSFDKSYNKAGWVFSDYRNTFNDLKLNTVIYGHSRLDNTMFGSLRGVLDDDWYRDSNNYIIKFSTIHENMIFLIFSVYVIEKESYYITTDFNNMDDYQEFLDTIYNRSQYEFGTSVDVKDKILTLSTCRDNYDNRIVIHAKMIKKEVY